MVSWTKTAWVQVTSGGDWWHRSGHRHIGRRLLLSQFRLLTHLCWSSRYCSSLFLKASETLRACAPDCRIPSRSCSSYGTFAYHLLFNMMMASTLQCTRNASLQAFHSVLVTGRDEIQPAGQKIQIFAASENITLISNGRHQQWPSAMTS